MSEGRGKRFGRLLGEAAMIVFAVLVALAVDQWNEGRERDIQVDRARAAIESEMRANQDELAVGVASVGAMHGALSDMLWRLRSGESALEWTIGAELPDFSDAAWETARVTGVVAHMDYEWVLRTARVYETQELARSLQNELVAILAPTVARPPEENRVADLQGQAFIVLQLYGNLERKLAEALGAEGSG